MAVFGDHLAEIQEVPAANFIFIDLSAIARRMMGRAFVSAAAAAVAAKLAHGTAGDRAGEV
jgi:argininosuccinate synthase